MLNRLMKLYKYRLQKTYETAVYGKRVIDVNRVPEPLRDMVARNEYVAASPYPAEHLIEELKVTPFLNKQTRIVTMGSCFSDEVNRWLTHNHYNVAKKIWGNVFTPQNFAQIMRYSFETETWNPAEPFWIIDGKYYDPYVKSHARSAVYLGESEAEARANLQSFYQHSAELLGEAEVVFWTLGITELWRNKQDCAAYFQMPLPEVFDPAKHEFYNLTYEESRDFMHYAITTLRKHNPHVKILISVSPVPIRITFREHLGPYVATQHTKSVLHALAVALTEQYDEMYYVPGYEITRMNPAAYYQHDGRHVNDLCINTVMGVFQKMYIQDS